MWVQLPRLRGWRGSWGGRPSSPVGLGVPGHAVLRQVRHRWPMASLSRSAAAGFGMVCFGMVADGRVLEER